MLIVTLLFVSLVTTYLVVLNFALLPSLQQFNTVLAYVVRMLMTDIDVQISSLSRMVEEYPEHPSYIQTVWGLGYVFVPDGSQA